MKFSCEKFHYSLAFLFLLTGCAAIEKTSPPALQGVEVETLTNSEDPVEMARVARRYCGYPSPLEKQLAAFKLAQRAYLKDPKNQEVDLILARCALFASGLINDEERKIEVVRKGYEAAAAGGGKNNPRVSYYYGACLGLLIEDKGVTAAGELGELEAALKKATEKAETDFGGPLRALGMLYLRAPSWPTGIGDLDQALELLERAAREFPLHPENHLFYAYALKEDGRTEEAVEELDRATSALVEGEWGDYAPIWKKDIAEFRKEITGR